LFIDIRPVGNSVLVQLKKHKHANRYQQGEEKTATLKMTEKMV